MNKAAKKQEIKDKVKEIKQRQQNWLRQRAEHGTSDSFDPVQSSPVKQESRTKPVDNIREYQNRKPAQNQQSTSSYKQPSAAEKLISTNKSKARFQNWLKAKHEAENVDQNEGNNNYQHQQSSAQSQSYNSTKYEDNYYEDKPYRDHSGHGDINILRVPSNRPSSFATPEPDWLSEDEITREVTGAKILSAEDFDTRADDIIAKVKGDMRMSTNHQPRSSDNEQHVHGRNRRLPEVEDPSSTKHGLSSHVCPTCEQLMLPAEFRPMLLIPCGHTLCTSCCGRTRYCGQCGCEVFSNTPNIMLQQIINDFHTKQTRRQQVSQSVTQSMSKNRLNSYQEEFQNLVTRHEILHEELDNIKHSVDKFNRKLVQNQQQVQNITKKERHLESEISRLQNQLAELRSHRQEYERNCHQLEGQAKDERNKMSLVQDSLKSVKQQMEKVKMLASGS